MTTLDRKIETHLQGPRHEDTDWANALALQAVVELHHRTGHGFGGPGLCHECSTED